MSVVIETTIGDITVDLFIEERPQTCRNFLKLCKIKYYNWNLFHSVQNNFIAQTGDPTGTGKGGESIYGIVLGEQARYYEAEQMPKIKHTRGGLLSMVNCGDNMLGSQFFITLAPDLYSLDGEHCVFGEIVEGLEIVLKFNETICDGDYRPYQDIRISHTVILEDPFDDPKGLEIPDMSPEPTKEALMSDRIGADELIDDTAGMSVEEVMEMQKDKEAKARATILEIVGDIPDADIAPPENVLFVCKLNPVTNDDDLEIIFSRFGKIVGCEVIRDRQTGDSLQYAFIEFAERKSCEEAYFKMDNVLIDDRRIHVDFSQSVAKMRWRGKGKGIKYYNDKEVEEEEVEEDGYEEKNDNRKGNNGRFRERNDRRDNNKRYREKYEEEKIHKRKNNNGDGRRHYHDDENDEEVVEEEEEEEDEEEEEEEEEEEDMSENRKRRQYRRNEYRSDRERSRDIRNYSTDKDKDRENKRRQETYEHRREREKERTRRKKDKMADGGGGGRSRDKSRERNRDRSRERNRDRSREERKGTDRSKEKSRHAERSRDRKR